MDGSEMVETDDISVGDQRDRGSQDETLRIESSQSASQKRTRDDDVLEEVEEKDDTHGLNFPPTRVQRIMRKHPDKKKKYQKETVHAVAAVTVRNTKVIVF